MKTSFKQFSSPKLIAPRVLLLSILKKRNLRVYLRRTALLSLLLLVASASATTQAQTTPFTYQGRLTDGGGPATGAYDLQFKLYDALSGGTQIGATVTLEDVAVSTGSFTVTLDFGAAAFPGANRWLEIGVRPGASTGAFTALSPLQPITSTPYAVQSLNATNAANAVNATNAINATNATNAASADALSAACNGCVTGARIAAGQVVKSFNGLFDNVTLEAGSNITITPSGNTLTLSGSSSGNNWSLTGNTGTTPSLNFLGTTDNQPLAFKINGAEVMRLRAGGNVGIGTAAPLAKLDARGDVFVGLTAVPDNTTTPGSNIYVADDGVGIGGDPRNSFRIDSYINNLYFVARSGAGSTAGAGISFRTAPAGGGEVDRVTIAQNGNVGIGTTSPTAKLDVNASVATDIGVLVDTASNNSIAVSANSPNIGVLGRIGLGSGLAGVPFTRTGVWGDTFAGDAVLGTSNTRTGVVGISDSGNGVVGGSNSGFGVTGSSSTGTAINGTSTSGTGVLGSGKFGVSGFGHTGGFGGFFQNVDGEIALFVEGTGRVNVLQVAGSDVAEHFDVVEEAKPGLVVAIDPDHPGQLSIARSAYNRRVAGIISGANKLDAGMVLSDLPGSKNSLPVALSGRVWVYCDATRSAIQPGDLLTTSNTPGHAMKVINHTKAQGAIIGKAMTGLKSGRGLVLVLVTLQ